MHTHIKEFLVTATDGKNYKKKHYNLQAIIAIGFKVENERAVQFRKWVKQDRLFMSDYDKYLLELEAYAKGASNGKEHT